MTISPTGLGEVDAAGGCVAAGALVVTGVAFRSGSRCCAGAGEYPGAAECPVAAGLEEAVDGAGFDFDGDDCCAADGVEGFAVVVVVDDAAGLDELEPPTPDDEDGAAV